MWVITTGGFAAWLEISKIRGSNFIVKHRTEKNKNDCFWSNRFIFVIKIKRLLSSIQSLIWLLLIEDSMMVWETLNGI